MMNKLFAVLTLLAVCAVCDGCSSENDKPVASQPKYTITLYVGSNSGGDPTTVFWATESKPIYNNNGCEFVDMNTGKTVIVYGSVVISAQ